MTTHKLNLALVTAFLLASAATPLALGAAPSKEQVNKLITVLQSNASQKEKADACRELATFGGKEAVAPLAAMLADEKLCHMALYGLETIPDPSVDDALRDALGKLKGRNLVAVIGSIGARRDAKAVKSLAALLQDPDADVAQAAARALGRIGTPASVKALEGALAKTSPQNQLAFCEGLFRCAESLAAKGEQKQARAVYDRLRQVKEPQQVRAGALRGAILTGGKDAIALLRQGLRSEDYILSAAAVRAAQELPGAEVTKALAEELAQLSADKQVLVIQELGRRGDAAGIAALSSAAKSGAKQARVAAVRSLAWIGQGPVAKVLADFLKDSDSDVARAAVEGLAAIPGPEADAVVAAMLADADAGRRLAGIDLVDRRRMKGSVPALLRMAKDGDSGVRVPALGRLGRLAEPSELPVLLELLPGLAARAELDAMGNTLSTLCARADKPEACVSKITGALAQAQPAQKVVLLGVLASVGGADALKAVRAAVDDTNADTHAAAIRALSAWKTPDAAPELIELARNLGDQTEKVLCLRGYIDWAGHSELPVDQRLAICRQASSIVQRDEEKKLLLGALGGLGAAEALELITPHLDNAATKDEAGAAVTATADKILKANPDSGLAAKLVEPLRAVADGSGNADLAKRAKALLEKAQAKAEGK